MQVHAYTNVVTPTKHIDSVYDETKAADEEEFGFFDLLDMVNPLQHIPIVGSIYRELTGDSIRSISRIVGGAAYGGVLGASMGIFNAIAENETGKDLPKNAWALVTDQREAYDSLPADILLYAQTPKNALEREASRYNN